MNQIINMIVRILMRKAINSGINAGIGAASGMARRRKESRDGNVAAGSPEQISGSERKHQKQVQSQAGQVKKMLKMSRRFIKF